MNLVQQTIYVSLIAQVFSTLYSILALQVPLYNENHILNEILGLETAVQFIEIIFYLMFGFILPTIAGTMDIAIFRYADWFITTPMMILSTVLFMDYVNRKEAVKQEKEKEINSVKLFIQKNWQTLSVILLANVWMLSMGYMKELGWIDIWSSTILGFAGFGVLFWKILESYVKHHKENRYIWNYMVVSWGMYGVAAIFPNVIKNTAYNLLDIVSKNFYSVFLSSFILAL